MTDCPFVRPGLALVLGIAAPLTGQTHSHGAYAGVHAGLGFDAPRSFSEGVCPDRSPLLVGLHLGYEAPSLFGVEGGVSLHTEDPELCVNGLIPPPPQDGTRTLRVLGDGVRGYPFATPEARAVFRSPAVGGLVSLRLAFGGAWMPSKDIGALLAGAGARVTWGGLRLTLDLERWWFDVPFADVEETYMGGELVSERRLPGGFPQNPILLRAGFGWALF